MENRAMKILEAIIDEYIKTGEPVGSKLIADRLGFSVSSATIRNEMAMLEVQGYLEHPHTSSGRVPTFNGIKLYIEKIMPQTKLDQQEQEHIDKIFEEFDKTNDETIIENATRALAEITKCAAISTAETSKFSVITKVEVIPTGKRMYVLLLITSDGSVKNKICRLSFDLTHEQMDFFKRFINENITGHDLKNVSDDYISRMSEAMGSYILSLSPLLKAVVDLSEELLNGQMNIDGEANLLACSELSSGQIAKIIESKNELTELLSQTFSGINVMFGKENDKFVISNASMITSSFNKKENKAGSFGIIGPVRLDYKKIIPYIEYFTDKVTNLLSAEEEDEELLMIEKLIESEGQNFE